MKICKMRAIIIVALCGTVLFYTPQGCKDPSQYAPPPDTLYPPPGAPQLISPIDHYIFMDPDATMYSPFFIEVELLWDSVENAEIYELEIITDNLPPNIIHCESNYWILVIHDDITKLCGYQWRVRAGSAQWEAMTDWSEQRHFEARWRPYGPELISPTNYEIINIDTLPSFVELTWLPIGEAEYYEVSVFIDTTLVDYSLTALTTYTYIIEDTTLYRWQIRAGSSLWQHFSFPASWYFFVQLSK